MRTPTIDHENKKIRLPKAFAKASGKYGSEEYKLLMEMKKDVPNYDVIVEEPKRKQPRDNYKGLTYDYMERYIETKENSKELMKKFNELRGISTEYEAIMKKASYLQVKKWFLTTFPEIEAYKEERKEAWEVIDREAKEQKKAKTENKKEKTVVNGSTIMLDTTNTTAIMH